MDFSSESDNLIDQVRPSRLSLILVACMANLLDGGMGAMMAPFFPVEAKIKSLSPSQYGLVLGTFSIGLFIFGPTLAPLVIRKIGIRSSVTRSMILVAISSTAFAAVTLVPSGLPYFLSCLFLQVLRAAGSATAKIAVYSRIMMMPDMARIYPMMELSYGLGLIVGPVFGGLLYGAGGFAAPFLATAVAEVLTATAAAFVFNDMDLLIGEDGGTDVDVVVSPLRLLTSPGVVLNLTIAMISTFDIGFTSVTLSQHVLDKGLDSHWISVLFAVSGILYVMSTQVCGILVARKEDHVYSFLMAGFFLSLMTCLLSGPMYPLTFETGIWTEVTRQVMYGLSMGPQMVGSFSAGKREVDRSGFGISVSSSSAFCSLFQSAFSLGSATGMPIGGRLLESVGYEKTWTFAFAINLLIVFLITWMLVWRRLHNGGDRN